ncbi:MAG: hypothetical protein MRY32_01150 [Rickettsiales bacterium]|nr:hypothetical protein [Rickettsiales bacterium]
MTALRILISTCLCLIAANVAAQDALNLGDCYISVEDMHQAMEEEPRLTKQHRELIEAILTRAVSACEAEQWEEGGQALSDATAEYHAALAEVNGDVTPVEFWQKADYMWGHRSYRKIDFRQIQLSCDDKTDYVAWRMDWDNPDHPGFNLLAVTKNDAGELKTAYINLPVGEGQLSVCTKPDLPDPTIHFDEKVTPDFQEELGIEVCPHIIRIDDGRCDNIRIMWPKDAAGEDVKFIIHRN